MAIPSDRSSECIRFQCTDSMDLSSLRSKKNDHQTLDDRHLSLDAWFKFTRRTRHLRSSKRIDNAEEEWSRWRSTRTKDEFVRTLRQYEPGLVCSSSPPPVPASEWVDGTSRGAFHKRQRRKPISYNTWLQAKQSNGPHQRSLTVSEEVMMTRSSAAFKLWLQKKQQAEKKERRRLEDANNLLLEENRIHSERVAEREEAIRVRRAAEEAEDRRRKAAARAKKKEEEERLRLKRLAEQEEKERKRKANYNQWLLNKKRQRLRDARRAKELQRREAAKRGEEKWKRKKAEAKPTLLAYYTMRNSALGRSTIPYGVPMTTVQRNGRSLAIRDLVGDCPTKELS